MIRRRRLVRVPASSANLGPGSTAWRRRSRCTSSWRWSRRARSRSRPSCRSRGGARTSACARSSACTRPTASRSGSARRSRSSGGLGSSAAAIVAGLMAADHLFELDADLLALAQRAGGASGQRRRGAARRLRHLRRRSGDALRAADRPGGARGRARRGGAHERRARGAGRSRCRWPTPSSTSRTARC